jgi:hypothetical protein
MITITRPATKTDPITGETIPDSLGVPTEVKLLCRLPHERGQVPDMSNAPSGFSTNLERMALFDWQNVPIEGDQFTAIGKGWRIGPVDTIRYAGGVKGYQAPLKEAE